MNWCEGCAIGMYNSKHRNLQGIGNPWNRLCIVIPNVDYDAYKVGSIKFSEQVEIIKECFLSSTGGILSNLYIVPLIRCNETISCPLDKISYNRCLHLFANDIKVFGLTDILLLGSAANRFLNCNIFDNLNNVFVSKNNKRYVVNYAPYIKFIDSNKFELFKQNLLKWYNAAISEDYINYNIYRL